MGQAISLRVSSLGGSKPAKVVKQIETPRSPDPIMRRPRKAAGADREEKRVTRGRCDPEERRRDQQEQLDLNDPNQRRLSVILCARSVWFIRR